MGIVGDHRVGGFQDATGGAVILFQLDHFQGRPVLLQLRQVFRAGTAPGVDGLVVIAHHGELARRQGEHLYHFVLGAVGVLVFIHQQVLDAVAPLFQDARLFAEHARRHQDQIVEIHGITNPQHAVVTAVGHGSAQILIGLGGTDRFFRQHQGVLPVGNPLVDHIHRVQIPFRFSLAQDFLEDFLAVGAVEDREAAAQAAGLQL